MKLFTNFLKLSIVPVFMIVFILLLSCVFPPDVVINPDSIEMIDYDISSLCDNCTIEHIVEYPDDVNTVYGNTTHTMFKLNHVVVFYWNVDPIDALFNNSTESVETDFDVHVTLSKNATISDYWFIDWQGGTTGGLGNGIYFIRWGITVVVEYPFYVTESRFCDWFR